MRSATLRWTNSMAERAVELFGEDEDGVLELALAIAERAFAEAGDEEAGGDEDGADQQGAADQEIEDRLMAQ